MTGLFSRRRPPFQRVLLIESGARPTADQFLRYVYQLNPNSQVDVLTCFDTPPETFQNQRGQMFVVTDPAIAGNRQQFLRSVASKPYDVVALLHTGSGILRKWKWAITLLTRAKIVLVPADQGLTFLDYGRFLQFHVNVPRLRREQVTRFRLAGEVLLMPFVISYLLIYAGSVHLRRLLLRP